MCCILSKQKRDNEASDLVVVAVHRCADDGEWKAMVDAFMNPENEVRRFKISYM